mmetsp:Transcript_135097/g.431708  ORF Transcript_135097/g.431708 Transcript_135097/m.431708 type:complete len:128 (+) Transcript_135097:38-421(+)
MGAAATDFGTAAAAAQRWKRHRDVRGRLSWTAHRMVMLGICSPTGKLQTRTRMLNDTLYGGDWGLGDWDRARGPNARPRTNVQAMGAHLDSARLLGLYFSRKPNSSTEMLPSSEESSRAYTTLAGPK